MGNVVKRRKYYENADIIRGFAIFLVVLGHAVAKENILVTDHVVCNVIYDFIYSFHMPLFFIISGFVFYAKDKLSEHLLHICRGLVIPYIVFNLAAILLQQLLPFLSVEKKSVPEQLYILILQGGSLWFIYVLIELRIIFFFVERIIRGKLTRAGILLSVSVVFLMLDFPLPGILMLAAVRKYFVYFMIGYFIKLMVEQGKTVNIVKINGLVLGIGMLVAHIILFYCKINMPEDIWYKNILNFIVALLGCGATYYLIVFIPNTWVRKTLISLGKTSFQIYIFNGYFIAVSRTLVSLIAGKDMVVVLALSNLFMGLVPNYMFSVGILKLKLVKMMFGKK